MRCAIDKKKIKATRRAKKIAEENKRGEIFDLFAIVRTLSIPVIAGKKRANADQK